jgi:hypothetical protein
VGESSDLSSSIRDLLHAESLARDSSNTIELGHFRTGDAANQVAQ